MLTFATAVTPVARTASAPLPDVWPAVELSAGMSGVFDGGARALRVGAEYFWRPVSDWQLTPGFGLTYTEGGARFLFADLRRDFWLDERWSVSVSFGTGLFHDDGGLELGSEVEFRSGVALSRRCGDRLRVGIGFFHVSNGGLSEKNPGTEALDLLINVPLGPEPIGD